MHALFIIVVVGTGWLTGSLGDIDVQRPNVLLIVIDDLRPAIGSYGDSKAITPNIDALARQGHHFRNAFAQQALCAPSRNSMLTGRRPDTIRLYDFYSYWRDESGNFTTLPQYFRQHGYQTHSVGKVFHPGISSNYTDDFPLSWSSVPYHPPTEKYTNEPVCVDRSDGRLRANLLCPVLVEEQPLQTLPDMQSTAEANRFLRAQTPNKPYFLAVGYHKPHIPFRIPFNYLDRHQPLSKFRTLDLDYPPYGLPTVAWSPFLDIRERDDVRTLNISFPFGRIPDDFKLAIRQHYYAAVTYIDELIGQLLSGVNMSETIVALTSDHGWSLGEHGEWAKYSNYDAALRVPLIIRSPNGTAARVDDVVELLDLFPTLVELAGLPPVPPCGRDVRKPTCTEGKSLVRLLASDARREPISSFAFSQYPRPGNYPTVYPSSDHPKLLHITIMGYSVRTERFRYTAWVSFNPATFERDWTTIHGEELYDHSIDPSENLNLADREQLSNTKHLLSEMLKVNFP